MIKIISMILIFIFVSIFFSRCYAELNIYTPEYIVDAKYNNIEIRYYDKFNVITTTETETYKKATYLGFKTLASYIFGNNKSNVKIPMTTPVITSSPNNDNIEISFILNNKFNISKMPEPNTDKIEFKEVSLGKVATISFGFWATPKRIIKFSNILKEYLNKNSIDLTSEFLVAQYNSPWVMPPLRKNEIIVSIK